MEFATTDSYRGFSGTARFQVLSCLGAGGMGVVYEALDLDKNARVALKTLRTISPEALLRFKQEFRTLQDLTHPNLVGLGELIEESGEWFFTMDLVDGVDFYTYVRTSKGGPRTTSSESEETLLLAETVSQLESSEPRTQPGPARAARVGIQAGGFDEPKLRDAMTQLVRGVYALHQAGKIHRDIKPSNILVSREGKLCLVDFGLVTDVVSSQAQGEKRAVGTMAFMAPEQAEGKQVGPAADWYSVGAVLYLALTGSVPHPGATLEEMFRKKVSQKPVPPAEVACDVPEDLSALCMELLSVDPASRPGGEHVLQRLHAEETDPSLRAAPFVSLGKTPFVGRERELVLLHNALEETRGGKCVTVFVRGESGLGKSTLIKQFLEGVRINPRALVFSGRCYERELLPYKALDGIVDQLSVYVGDLEETAQEELLGDDAPLLARLFPVLRRVPAAARPLSARQLSPHELRVRAFMALRSLLTRLSIRGPVVLFVDDFQWADPDSLTLLREVFQPPGAPPVLVVATLRQNPGEEAGLPTTVAKATSGLDVRLIPLARLSQEETDMLIQSLLPSRGRLHSDNLRAIAREAAGHPMFIHEMIWHGSSLPESGQGALHLDEALWARACRLDRADRMLLAAVAVAGTPVAQRVIARALQLDVGECTKRALSLRSAHLVSTAGMRGSDTIEPYHDRVREAVLGRLEEKARKEIHRALANALEVEGAAARDPLLLLRHLEAAGETAHAATLARHAAVRASESLAFEQAAELYRTALRLGVHAPEEARRLHQNAAEALVHAGRNAEAAEEYLLAADGATGTVRLDCQRRAAHELLVSGHLDRGREVLARVLAEIGEELPKTPKRALALLLWSRFKVRLRGLRWKERSEQEIAPISLMRLDTFLVVGEGLAMTDNVRGTVFQARGVLMALKLGEKRRICKAFALEAIFLATQGRRSMPRARLLSENVDKLAKELSDPHARGWAMGCRGLLSYMSGHFAEAAPELGEAERLFREHPGSIAWEINNARVYRLISLRQLGAFCELARHLGEYLSDAVRRGDRFAETTLTWGLTIAWLVQGKPGDARRALDETPWTPPEGGFHVQHYYELRSRVEVDLYNGDGATSLERHGANFRALGKSLLMRVDTVRKEMLWLRGRASLAAAEASSDKKSHLLAARSLAARLFKEKNPYSSAYGHLLLAGVSALCRQDGDALLHLRDGCRLAEERNMRFWAMAARRQEGILIGGDEGSALVAQASAWMAGEGIQDAERMCRMAVPGFGK